MIRGIDFYNYCFQTISQQDNFDILLGEVNEVFSNEQTGATVAGETFYADYVFNSIPMRKPSPLQRNYWLLQHFKGWVVETREDFFDEATATLMDFRAEQKFGTAFSYILPFNSRQALVEYTVFSPELLQQDDYDESLRHYVENILKIQSYTLIEKEFGVIPMTNYKFPSRQNNIINVGTAGGQTKGSTGYTFNFIQKHSKSVVEALIKTGKPFVKDQSKRFNFYDSVFLKVLMDRQLSGEKIFTTLFRNNHTNLVLPFLDNESSLAEEIKIISSLPILPFLKAGFQQLM
jgi:lycopene beta-cyclase